MRITQRVQGEALPQTHWVTYPRRRKSAWVSVFLALEFMAYGVAGMGSLILLWMWVTR